MTRPKSTAPRGKCPECGRSICSNKYGKIGPHGDKVTFPPTPCDGWGKRPEKEE